MKPIMTILGLLVAIAETVNADDPSPITYPSVAATLEALQADPSATFEKQSGWTVVASRENENPVQWFFTPEEHPAHPSVVKRTVVEKDGVGYIDLVTLCQVPQSACDQLLDDFRQVGEQPARSVVAEQVMLDVGIALNDHDRLGIKRLLTQEGMAAEIRMDDLLKIVIVPTLNELGEVLLWTAMYKFDGSDYVLLSEPVLAAPGAGTAAIEVSSEVGDEYGFVITPTLARRE